MINGFCASSERTGLPLVQEDRARVEPVGVEDAPPGVRQGDDLRVRLVEQPRRDRARVAEPLDRDARPLQRDPPVPERLRRGEHHPAPGRLLAAERPADLHRFPGHRADGAPPLGHADGVHEPGHDLRVRVDVGGGDILRGADERSDLGRVAARQVLELPRRHRLRVADHAALRPAVGDVDHRALPGHPHRQRPHLVEVDAGVVPYPPLRRTADEVVLDAVAGEDARGPVVHPHRDGDGELALGMAEAFVDVRIEIEDPRGTVELRAGRVPCSERCRVQRVPSGPNAGCIPG